MKDLADLISAIASLLWPVILAAVILMLRPTLLDLVASAKSRRFTIKVGGQELTMNEANEQQQQLISDLQSQIIDLKNKLNLGVPEAQTTSDTIKANAGKTISKQSILWVDDIPKNNSYLIEQLAQAGIHVDTALSTSEAINLFDAKKYSLIVSDMGRQELNFYNPHAGLDLLQSIRRLDSRIPFVLFTSSKNYEHNKEIAESLGANYITSSATELAGIFRAAFNKNHS